MASHKVVLKAIAIKEYEAIASKTDRRRVLWKIAALIVDPRPPAARRLPERAVAGELNRLSPKMNRTAATI